MWTRWTTFLFEYNMAAGYRNCNRIVVVASVAIVTFAYALQIVTADQVNPVDLQAGDFCAKVGCCSERNENCSVPISGTLCYCDEFCYVNRTGSEDCCPDYMSYCKVEFLAPEPIIYKPIPDDLAGDFCKKLGCCSEGRNESCSVPILGTLCYCDEFCYVNRTGSEDCCPDFMSYCKGVELPAPDPLTNKRN